MRDLRTTLALAVTLALALALSGCGGGGGGDDAIIKDELPVACVAKPKPGNCMGAIPKIYYDFRDNRCKTFYWSGCGGFVPYQTMEACVKECEGHD
jgi:hypothetical protein